MRSRETADSKAVQWTSRKPAQQQRRTRRTTRPRHAQHLGVRRCSRVAAAQLRLLRGDPTLGQLPGYQSGDIADLQIDFDGPYALDGELFDNRGTLRLSLSDPIRWLPFKSHCTMRMRGSDPPVQRRQMSFGGGQGTPQRGGADLQKAIAQLGGAEGNPGMKTALEGAAPAEHQGRKRTFGKLLMRTLDAFLVGHSKVSTTPFLERAAFPWVTELEAEAETIRAELNLVLQRPEDIPPFTRCPRTKPASPRGTIGGPLFSACLANASMRTANAARTRPRPSLRCRACRTLGSPFWPPDTIFPPHRGPTKAVVRCHLGLVIPAQAEQCWIRVGGQTRHWENGRCLLFDDTFEHEVRNDTAEARVVLFIDVDRPLDAIGERCRRMVLGLLRASSYVKRPLANLERWNQRLRPAGD